MSLPISDYIFKNYFGGLEPDPRSKDWFLVDNLDLLIVIATLYVIVSIVGPKAMSQFKPYELRRPIMIYNALMIAVNGLIFYMAASGGWFTHYNFLCQPYGTEDDPKSYRMARAMHFMYLSKFVELLDTVFFILRKKERQISFLHVYHHSTVIVMFWASARYIPDGHHSLMVLVNSFIHIIMYTYYLLSNLGPQMQKYLWWKKYLTRMQLSQFLIVIMHNFWLFHPSCDYPRIMSYFSTFNLVIFFVLFTNFYVKNYKEKAVKVQIKETENNMGKMCFSAQAVKQD